jgi:hypothetical protein
VLRVVQRMPLLSFLKLGPPRRHPVREVPAPAPALAKLVHTCGAALAGLSTLVLTACELDEHTAEALRDGGWCQQVATNSPGRVMMICCHMYLSANCW